MLITLPAPHVEDLVLLPSPVLRLLNLIDDNQLHNEDEYEGRRSLEKNQTLDTTVLGEKLCSGLILVLHEVLNVGKRCECGLKWRTRFHVGVWLA